MLFSLFLYLHIFTVGTTLVLFVTRFYWLCRQSSRLQQPWIRVVPHINDTLLLLSGAALVILHGVNPFTAEESWLTTKLFGVIIYVLLGQVALGRGRRSLSLRGLTFILALICFCLIVQVAITKLAFLME